MNIFPIVLCKSEIILFFKENGMKTAICAAIICSVMVFPAYSQNKNAKPQTAKEEKTTQTKQAKNIAQGYGNVKWGSYLNDVKNNVAGRIIYMDEKRIIISRDGDLEYRYGFFYPEYNQTSTEPQQPKLFYVIIQFPYIALDDVKKKMEEKYGPATGESIKNNQGAYIWDSESTAVVLWVDSYEKKPFCRKITYVSKIMAKDINAYHTTVFSKKEQEIIKKLQP